MKIILVFLAIALIALTIQAVPVNQDEVGDQLFHQGRLANIIKDRREPISDEVGDNEFFKGAAGNLIGLKKPNNNEPDEVGDFQFYQGPFTNLIRAIQNLMKREKKATNEDNSIELTPRTF